MALTDTGVLAWCDIVRSTMRKDPGRELFESQIQQHGFDFIDNYLEDVLSRQATEPVFELLKTPGKKNAPKRAKAAAAVAAKLRAAVDTIFEEREKDETSAPVNDLQRALMDARDDKRSSHHQLPTEHFLSPKEVLNVTDVTNFADIMEVDDAQDGTFPAATPAIQPESGQLEHPPSTAPQEVEVQHPLEETSTPPFEETPVASIHDTEESVPTKQDPLVLEVAPAQDETLQGAPAEGGADLSVIAEDDEMNEPVGTKVQVLPSTSLVAFPQYADNNMDQDMTVPIKDSTGASSLKRKQTVSVPGLSAPSPLRKSMRMSREPSASNPLSVLPLAQTPGTGLGGKRTSWLSKAKEVKALEFTIPKTRPGGSAESSSSLANMSSVVFGSAGSLKNILQSDASKEAANVLALDVQSTANKDSSSADVMDVDGSDAQLGNKGPPALPLADDVTGRIESAVHQQIDPDFTSKSSLPTFQPTPYQSAEDFTIPIADELSEAQALDRLKKTVVDVGARATRSLGKSLGGNAAAALAEARAAAEARIAQRNKADHGDVSVVEVESSNPLAVADPEVAPPGAVHAKQADDTPVDVLDESDRRFSLSELVTTSSIRKDEVEPKVVPPSINSLNQEVNTSISTTPPNSPPPISVKPPKPAPEFKPSAAIKTAPVIPSSSSQDELPAAIKNFQFKLPSANPFSLPVPSTLGAQAATEPVKPVFVQASKASLLSDNIFYKEVAAQPSAPVDQNTEYSTAHSKFPAQHDELDDDDSWHMDEKFRSNETWTPYGFVSNEKDDNTWSTIPSRSDGDTGKAFTEALHQAAPGGTGFAQGHKGTQGPFDFDSNMEKAHVNANDIDEDVDMEQDMEVDDDPLDSELQDIIAAGKSTITFVQKSEPPRSQSQMSTASGSTVSSQGNAGLLGQATRFMSSMLGTSKNTKGEPLKSISRAAAIAKKQQDEADKRAARLKEMENRRQLALQRKAEEEKARAEEEERKIKEENEKRKRERDREREEHTGKFAVKISTKKNEDDTTSKRKPASEVPKKPESKKPPSKDALHNRTLKVPSSSNAPGTASKGGATLKALSKQPSGAGASSSQKPAANEATSSKPTLKGAMGKAKANVLDRDDRQPSQSQAADRAKSQVQAAQTPREPPPVSSESIELPDINSEYSDSEDEDRPRTFDPPEWARSPQLHQRLEEQSRWDPDDIFGRVGPLRMEEIFRTRQSRFRARTSSANWSGPDQLTQQEEENYARRMGFRK